MNHSRIGNARRLRREATRSERILWSKLKGGRLQGLKFRRQVPIDRYFADFCCPKARVIVELDGDSHLGREAHDAHRTRVLESLGYLVIRFPNSSVLENCDGVMEAILRHIDIARNREAPVPVWDRDDSSPIGRGRGPPRT